MLTVCPQCDRPPVASSAGELRCSAGHVTPLLTGGLPFAPSEPPDQEPIPTNRLLAVATSAASVRPRSVAWLWPGRVPLGKLVILDGDPGLGKSLVTVDLAARITTGRPLPETATSQEPGSVIMLNAEDGEEDTIVPRLRAAGADMARVMLMQGVVSEQTAHERPVSFPSCTEPLASLVKRSAARLVVIDPVMAYLDATVNANNDQSVRAALQPLKEMAERLHCAVLFVRHLNKAAGLGALYRGGGSIGINGAVRSGLLVAADPEDPDRRLLAPTKSNLTARPATLAYRIAGDPPAITWEGPVARSADDLLGAGRGGLERGQPEPLSKVDAAIRWLEEELAEGTRTATSLYEEADSQGITPRVLRMAAARMGVLRHKQGFGSAASTHWQAPVLTH